MKYVNDESKRIEIEIRNVLFSLPKAVGLCFVSVEATPEEGGISTEFNIFLGTVDRVNPNTIKAVISSHLKQYSDKYNLAVEVKRGLFRKID